MHSKQHLEWIKNNILLHSIDFRKTENTQEWVTLDSGASSNFLLTAAPALNKTVAQNQINIRLPYGS